MKPVKRQSPLSGVALTIAVLTAMSSTGCTPTLKASVIEQQIQSEIEQQGNLSLQSITCPRGVAIAPETTFRCVGELTPEGIFVIEVTQQDEVGTIVWDIPNSRQLLNLTKLETHFQEAIAGELGTEPEIDCGGTFRMTKPGDSFECQVANAVAIESEQAKARLVNVLVTVGPQGSVNWQQIRQEQAVQPERVTPTPAPTAPATGAASPATTTSQPAAAVAPSSKPAQSADDFLNDPAALEGFD